VSFLASMAVMIDEQLLQSFAFYSAILLFKMISMSGLTAINRIRRKIFANPEDAAAFGGDKVVFSDPVVERIRRCHMNDMENIFLFILLALFYSLTGPSYVAAVWIFRIFTISRFVHMYVYLTEAPQPRRFLSWLTGWICCWIMVVQIFRATPVPPFSGY